MNIPAFFHAQKAQAAPPAKKQEAAKGPGPAPAKMNVGPPHDQVQFAGKHKK